MNHQTRRALREPQTHCEDVIRGIFGNALALPADQISIDTTFVELGGHPQLATHVAEQIGKAFNIELSLSAILEQGTIERLGHQVDELTKRLPKGKPLGLRSTGAGLPLFCIHPSSGLGRPYRELLPYLGPDIPVYALEARGINDGDKLPETLDDMCTDYINQIRDIQPNSPYRLCGWSFGAIPAHALAVALQARGLKVSCLVILDGFPFDGRPWLDGLVSSHRSHWEKEILSYRELDAECDERKSTILDRLCAIKRNNVLLQRYSDPGTFIGDMLLVKSPESERAGSKMFPWHEYVSGETLEIVVPYGHNVLLSSEAAAAYAPDMTDYLKRPY
jgi:thioesterase domain-containing protein